MQNRSFTLHLKYLSLATFKRITVLSNKNDASICMNNSAKLMKWKIKGDRFTEKKRKTEEEREKVRERGILR